MSATSCRKSAEATNLSWAFYSALPTLEWNCLQWNAKFNATMCWKTAEETNPLESQILSSEAAWTGMGENMETGKQPKPSERGSIFKEGSRRWSIWEEGAQANRMIRIWQGQQRKEWELCSMSTCSIANTKLQKTPACAFLYLLFCTSLEEEEAFCCCSGSLAMATALLLPEAKGCRVMLVAFWPEAEGWWGAGLTLIPGSPLLCSLCHHKYSTESYSINDPSISLCLSLRDGQKCCCLPAET